jgi:hypothetical protein
MKKFTSGFSMLTLIFVLFLTTNTYAQDPCTPTDQTTANITATSADLSWENLTGPTWVRYYPTGTQEYKFKFAHENNETFIHWLTPGTEYTWELNTLCDTVWTDYGWPQTFTTLEDTVVCEPTNQVAENITAHSADLSWEGLTDLTWVRYYPTGTQDYKYKFAQLNNAVELNWLMPETEYSWELNTLCNGTWTDYGWAQTFTTIEDTVVCEPTNQVAENVTAHSADLSWEGLTGQTWVRYYPTGTQDYKYKYAQLNNAVQLNWLVPETEYTWELNTLCNGTWTDYGWPQTFTTLEDTVVCEPTNQAAENVTAHSADLSWEGLTGPTWVRYYPTGTQEYKYKYAQLNNAVQLNWLMPETEYTWELNTLCNGTWTDYGWAQTFTTLEDTVVCEPTNQVAENVTAHSADLSWEGLTGPTWVRYYISGTQEYRYKYAQENNEVSLQCLTAETEYTWELNTLCNGSWSGFDWPQTFITLEDTAACEPVNQIAENVTAHTAELSWEGLSGLTWVKYYKTGVNGCSFKFADTSNMVILNFLEADTEYTWEINTLCNNMWTGYGWEQTFVTLPDSATSFEQAVKNAESFKITDIEEAIMRDASAFPNPTSGQTEITYSSSKDGATKLMVLNVIGSLIYEENYSSTEGENTITIDLEGQNNGIYFVIISMENQIEKIKLIKR